jgi:Putative transposase/Transposase zinc-binding domain
MEREPKPQEPIRLADLIRNHHDEFLDRHGSWLNSEQRRALRDLARCRTAALGGHVRRCSCCDHIDIYYNSCRNRHCPSCQAGQRAIWLDREAQWLLPVEYHHVVFTLPSELSEVTLRNPVTVYNLLFQAASETIREIAADPKYLGAQVGLLLMLHTWGQNLHHHPHVHGIVTGGGLSCDASGQVDPSPRWVSCRRGFFLPVRVLSRVYRGKFLAGLRQAYARGQLIGFEKPDSFGCWLATLQRQDWVVYSQPPAAGPEVVLKYLARYVHRVAISESRLVSVENGKVTFTLKDYREGGRVKSQTLDVIEFLRRWVQHVLPRGFVKARHYGLLANRYRDEKRVICRRLLGPIVIQQQISSKPVLEEKRFRCRQCGVGVMAIVMEIPPESRGPGEAEGTDQSRRDIKDAEDSS